MYKAIQLTYQHLLSYLTDNLSCLFYPLDLVTEQCSWLISYTNLLLDISEIFGAWVVLSMLLISTIATLAYTHSTTSFIWAKSKSGFKNLYTSLTLYKTLNTALHSKYKHFK